MPNKVLAARVRLHCSCCPSGDAMADDSILSRSASGAWKAPTLGVSEEGAP